MVLRFGSTSGTPLKSSTVPKRGIHVAEIDTERAWPTSKPGLSSLVFINTDRVFFPLAEDSLEHGGATWGELDPETRDFPRRLDKGLFQYPMLTSIARIEAEGTVCIVASPYFSLLRYLISLWQPGRIFTAPVAVDVKEAFRKLKGIEVKNGTLSVRAGRMIITGIPFLRSAVFFGENVIQSRLYSELNGAEGVLVEPKDCRLARNYLDPVGGNRRPFVCWFDQHGNFRFTPGADWSTTACKLLELINVLGEFGLLRTSATANPLNKAALGGQAS